MGVPLSIPLAQQRSGIQTAVDLIPEDAWAQDPGAPIPFRLPVSDKVGYKAHGSLDEAPAYDGTMLTPDKVDMNREADGAIPCGLEFLTKGRVLKLGFGANGYSQPSGGTGKIHKFRIPTTIGSMPISFQIVKRKLQATAMAIRTLGNYISSINYPFATAGRASYTLNCIGNGKELKTSIGGAASYDGYRAKSYFNMRMIIAGKIVLGLTSFEDTLDFGISRTDVGANEGLAGGLVPAYITAKGKLGTVLTITGTGIEADFNLWDIADAQTPIYIEYICANNKLSIATEWFRKRYCVRLVMNSPEHAGKSGETQEYDWELVRDGLWSAERFADIAGTYNIAAGDVIGVKLNGGGTVSIPLTTGAARTAAQIVADFNAVAGFTALADAYEFMGRPMLVTKLTGTGASIQIDTAVGSSAHAKFGWDNIAYTGEGTAALPCPLIYEVYNALGVAY